MLVLNRKSNQEIVLGGNVFVRILSVKGNTVRLGIQAPGEVSILRGELVTTDEEPVSENRTVDAPAIQAPASAPSNLGCLT